MIAANFANVLQRPVVPTAGTQCLVLLVHYGTKPSLYATTRVMLSVNWLLN